METSRRNFLKTGTMGLVFAGVPAVLAKVAVGSPIATGAVLAGNTFSFTRDTFTPHMNTTFRIKTGAGAVNISLTKITDLKAISKTPARIAGKESFSLLFDGLNRAQFLTQDTYVVEHKALGRFSLFLVPVGKSANRQYEAIIIRV